MYAAAGTSLTELCLKGMGSCGGIPPAELLSGADAVARVAVLSSSGSGAAASQCRGLQHSPSTASICSSGSSYADDLDSSAGSCSGSDDGDGVCAAGAGAAPSAPSRLAALASDCFGGRVLRRMTASLTHSTSSGSLCSEGEGGADAEPGDAPPPAQHLPPAAGAPVARAALFAVTPDGWRLHLHRVSPAAGAGAPARECPVVLCPGLASGGLESFDLAPSASLAQHLAERGYDVWVPDLRGNGRSDKHRWWDRSKWWTVDDHLLSDVPTVIDAVLAATGASQVHWVGHSMGGMLAVGAISRGLACAAALRSLTLLGSGCFGAGSWHAAAAPLIRAVTAYGFHAGALVPLFDRMAGPAAPVAWITRALFYDRSNVRQDLGRKLLGSCLSYIPPGVVAQFMGSMNSPLGISSADGTWNYADPKVLAHSTTPVLGANGDRDWFCPAAGGLKTINLFGGPHRRFLFLGPAYGTTQHHYGHFDPLISSNARCEVFPHVEAFISEFDRPQAPAREPSTPQGAAS